MESFCVTFVFDLRKFAFEFTVARFLKFNKGFRLCRSIDVRFALHRNVSWSSGGGESLLVLLSPLVHRRAAILEWSIGWRQLPRPFGQMRRVRKWRGTAHTSHRWSGDNLGGILRQARRLDEAEWGHQFLPRRTFSRRSPSHSLGLGFFFGRCEVDR